MANPTNLDPLSEEYQLKMYKDLESLGLDLGLDNQLKYNLLVEGGKPIDKAEFGKSLDTIYKETRMGAPVTPAPTTPPSKPHPLSIGSTINKPPSSNIERDAQVPLDVSGEPSALASLANKLSKSFSDLDKQIDLSPEQRRGLAGLLATALPQRYATSGVKDSTGKDIAGVSSENELMYVLRLLNLPSAAANAAVKTAYEELTGNQDTKDESWLPDEAMANLAQSWARNEGVAEALESGAKIAENKVKDATGIKPELKLNNWGPDIGIDPSNMAWWLGMGADILIPSTGEALAITKNLPGSARKYVSELKKLPPLPEPVPAKTPSALPDKTMRYDEMSWDTKRTIDAGQEPSAVIEERVKNGGRPIETKDVVLTESRPTPEMFTLGRPVIQVDELPTKDNNVAGTEYILDQKTNLPVPVAIYTRVRNEELLEKRYMELDKYIGKQADLPAERTAREYARREAATPDIVANKKAHYALKKADVEKKLSSEAKVDIFGTGTVKTDNPIQKGKELVIDEYKSKLSALEDRWKYHLNKNDVDGAFNDTFAKLADEGAGKKANEVRANDVFDEALIGQMIEPILKGDATLSGKPIAPILRGRVAGAVRSQLLKQVKKDYLGANRTYFVVNEIYSYLDDAIAKGLEVNLDGELLGVSIDKIPPQPEAVTRAWYEASSEAVALSMIRDVKLDVPQAGLLDKEWGVLRKYFGRDKIKDNEVLDEAVRMAQEHLSAAKKDLGYSDFIRAITYKYNANQTAFMGLPYTPVKYEEVYDEFAKNRVFFNLMRDLNKQVDELAMWEMVRQTLGNKSYRKYLAHAIEADSALSDVLDKLPTKVREARSKNLVETIAADLKTNPEDLPYIVKLLGNIFEGHSSFLRQSLLGGTVLPNLRYLTMNVLSNPLVVYQQLGLGSTLGMLRKVPLTTRLAGDISARRFIPKVSDSDIIIEAGKNPEFPKGLTYAKLRDLVIDNDITKGQTSFELSGDVLQSMIQHLDPPKANAFRRYLGLTKEPSYWNSIANDLDVVARSGVFVHALENGDSVQTAARKARESLFDYNSLSEFEKKYVSSVIWFYSFLRHNTVRTAKTLMTGKGQTRIKNLMLSYYKSDELDEGEGISPSGKSRYRFRGEPTDRYVMHGPDIPVMSAMDLMSEAVSFVFWLGPESMGGGGIPQQAGDIFKDRLASMTVNPYISTLVSWLSDGKFDLRNRRQLGDGPDPRIVTFWKAMGWLEDDGSGLAGDLFHLVPDIQKGGREGAKGFDNSLYYKFDKDIGRENYSFWQMTMWDTLLGLGRGSRDWSYFIHPGLTSTQKVSTGIGLTTPLRKENLVDQKLYRESDLNKRYKQQR